MHIKLRTRYLYVFKVKNQDICILKVSVKFCGTQYSKNDSRASSDCLFMKVPELESIGKFVSATRHLPKGEGALVGPLSKYCENIANFRWQINFISTCGRQKRLVCDVCSYYRCSDDSGGAGRGGGDRWPLSNQCSAHRGHTSTARSTSQHRDIATSWHRDIVTLQARVHRIT